MTNNQIFKQTEIGKIPNGWEVVAIKEICRVKRGASPRPIGDPSYFSDSGRGWIRISDVTDARKFLRKTSQYLSKKGEERSVKVNPGDLIMSICATIGKPIILDMEACVHDGFVWFSDLSSNVDIEYLFYVLQKNEFTFSSKRQTGTQGNINTSLVGMTNIPLPHLPEQKKIAEILSTVDQGIEKVDEAIKKTKRLKNGLMQELLSKGIGHKEFKDTEIGRIPKEWEIAPLKEVVDINKETRDPKREFPGKTFSYIDIDSIENGTGIIKGAKEILGKEAPSRARRLIRYYDVLMSTVRPYLKAFAIVPTELHGQICSTGFAVLTCKERLLPLYLLNTLFNKPVINQCNKMMVGAQYPALNSSQVEKIKIPVPPLTEQRKIAEILGAVDKRLELLRSRKERLERIKKGLMEDLLTGRKRVKLN